MYAPHRVLMKYLARRIYWFAEARYGAEARGPVADKLNEKQKAMLARWSYWMDVKNRIYNISQPSLADRLERLCGQSVK